MEKLQDIIISVSTLLEKQKPSFKKEWILLLNIFLYLGQAQSQEFESEFFKHELKKKIAGKIQIINFNHIFKNRN